MLERILERESGRGCRDMIKRGYLYRHQNKTYQYLGRVEHMGTGEILAILRSFKDEKTFVKNHEEFEWLVETGEYTREVVNVGE